MLCQASGVCFLLLVSAINLSTSDNSSLPNTIAENILFDTNTTSIKNKLQSTNNEDTEYSVQTATELIYDGLTTELTFNDIAEFNDSSTDFTSTDSTTDFTSTDSTTTLTSTDSTTALTSTDSTTAVTSTDSTTDLTSIDPTTESTTIEVTSTELTTTTCPSIPENVETITLEPDKYSIMVRWTSNSNSDCVSEYNIKWKPVVKDDIMEEYTSASEYNITDLEACTEYEVTVTAIYDGSMSKPVSQKNFTETGDLRKVENLKLRPETNSVIVTWSEPPHSGACVEEYYIEWKDESDSPSNVSVKELSHTIPKLRACTEYEIHVTAVYESGDSESEYATTSTDFADPQEVENLLMEPDTRSIKVTWSEPNGSDACIRTYNIKWQDEAGNPLQANTSDLHYNISNLKACTFYEVNVTAIYKNDESVLASIMDTTKTADPQKVENLVTESDTHSIMVTWLKPKDSDACIKTYNLKWKDDAGSPLQANTLDLFYNISNLKACTHYEINVTAIYINDRSFLVPIRNTTKTAVPEIVTNLSVKAVTLSSLSVQWKRPERTGNCIKKYKLEWKDVAGNYSTNNNTFPNTESYELKDLIPCATYEISVQAVNTDESYSDSVSGKEKTLAEVSDAPSDPQQVCTGTDNVCLRWTLPDINSNRCNRLKFTAVCTEKDTPEQLKFEATSFDLNNDTIDINVMGLSSSTAYLCQGKMENNAGISNLSEIIEVVTESDVPVGMIVGILLAVVALGIFALLYVSYRKGALVWPPKFFSGAKQTTVRPQPVLVRKFPEYCTRMLEIPTRLDNEYQLLKTLSVDIETSNTFDNGKLPANKRKNRYVNILPYDATRVTLDVIDGDPTSHYINASFIKGYNDDIEYIAAQGPTEDTTMDFWRMVFQHDVRVIVMVTNLVEQERIKCHQYYPNLRENVTYGDMTICCTTEIKFPIHTARTLVLMKGDRKRTLSHLHFREWPDFGVPHSTDLMIQFCQTMRHHAFAAELGLILVHCSAGVGRTGTLIAVDILLQHICENKKVDIFGTVFKLRKQRMNMVQTEGQYAYIYRCIKDAVEDPTIVKNGTPTNNSLEPIYENVGTSLNTLQQYEKLPKVSSKNSSSESECEL
ncbi:receptor-type tyrosine-protein phosphatase H-like isoform X4 [Periplaneta americana]|uniref:receptor-type tyrosine-protein phosphatase H-like isoform X4 n=1 Tax=Periplaneta americana TaxID=6978 RepID=UPI0037E8B8B0